MDKSQDADLEKGYETIEDASVFIGYDRAPLVFDEDEDDLFTTHEDEREFEDEPEGAFLD
ncbi:MAG: hypothetical protein M4D80_31110 [Myxococcota bacterium]|nr:hypothetical protein [Deltaproteobacteria bacterium]MDQ3339638.1 hypothetical protein [Myxococcota bacterium]